MTSDVAYEITRSVSKTGGLGLITDGTLQCACQLTIDEKVALYMIVREESLRSEHEWRREFSERLDVREELLPDVAVEPVDLEGFLMWAKSHDDREEILDSFEEIIEQSSDLSKLRSALLAADQPDLVAALDDYRSMT